MFGFVAKGVEAGMENVCHVFAEYDPLQPCNKVIEAVQAAIGKTQTQKDWKKPNLGQMSPTVLLKWTNDRLNLQWRTVQHTDTWQACLNDRCSIQYASIHSIAAEISILFISFPDQNRLACISALNGSDEKSLSDCSREGLWRFCKCT